MSLETKLNQNLKCDNKNCQVGFTWEEAPNDETMGSAPDAFWRFLILALPGGQEKWTFCSKYCLLDFMKKFEARKSPREIQEEANQKMAQAAKIEAQIEDGSIERLVGEGGIG